MSSPIGSTVGNALEVREAIEILRGEGPPDTLELTLALGVEMLKSAGVDETDESARRRLERALATGAGAERLERMIALHGGDARVVADVDRLPRAPYRRAVRAPRSGYIGAIDALALGRLGITLGAGRTRADQKVDPRVGIELSVRLGARVEAGQPLAILHLGHAARAPEHVRAAAQAFSITAQRPRARPRVLEHIAPA
jgi:pyrimidine-nucleoside phosphorylase